MAKQTLKEKEIAEAKRLFLEYFADLPIKRYAAAHAGKSEDQFEEYQKSDPGFAEQIQKLRSAYLMRNVKGIKSKEWLVERLFRQEFQSSHKVEADIDAKLTINMVSYAPPTDTV